MQVARTSGRLVGARRTINAIGSAERWLVRPRFAIIAGALAGVGSVGAGRTVVADRLSCVGSISAGVAVVARKKNQYWTGIHHRAIITKKNSQVWLGTDQPGNRRTTLCRGWPGIAPPGNPRNYSPSRCQSVIVTTGHWTQKTPSKYSRAGMAAQWQTRSIERQWLKQVSILDAWLR